MHHRPFLIFSALCLGAVVATMIAPPVAGIVLIGAAAFAASRVPWRAVVVPMLRRALADPAPLTFVVLSAALTASAAVLATLLGASIAWAGVGLLALLPIGAGFVRDRDPHRVMAM